MGAFVVLTFEGGGAIKYNGKQLLLDTFLFNLLYDTSVSDWWPFKGTSLSVGLGNTFEFVLLFDSV